MTQSLFTYLIYKESIKAIITYLSNIHIHYIKTLSEFICSNNPINKGFGLVKYISLLVNPYQL
jgi:hypothetical protein